MLVLPYNKTKTMFGALRATEAFEKETDAIEARAMLISGLRSLFDEKPEDEPVDEAIAAYVTDVALPRELYADGMRRRVTSEDIEALLTYKLGYFDMREPHHYALVRTWWGYLSTKVLVADSVGVSGQDELEAVTTWYESVVMHRKGIAHLELAAWTPGWGLEGSLEMEDGESFEDSDILNSPAVAGDDEFEQLIMIWSEHARQRGSGTYTWSAGAAAHTPDSQRKAVRAAVVTLGGDSSEGDV